MDYRVLENLPHVPKPEITNCIGKMTVNLFYASGCEWEVFEFISDWKLVGFFLSCYYLGRFVFLHQKEQARSC